MIIINPINQKNLNNINLAKHILYRLFDNELVFINPLNEEKVVIKSNRFHLSLILNSLIKGTNRIDLIKLFSSIVNESTLLKLERGGFLE